MSPVMNDSPQRDALIDEVQKLWSESLIRFGLTPEEGLNCAGHFLANITLSLADTEAAAHDLTNSITESNHLYINANWTTVQEKRATFMEERARARTAQEGL